MGDRLEALYVLALTTGMRQRELLALRWPFIDLEHGSAQIVATMQSTKAGRLSGEPKTRSSTRRITLGPSAIEALRRHHVRQTGERLALGPAWEDHGLAFPNKVGRPETPGNLVVRSFKPLLRRAGVPNIRFHDLRHTAATLLLEQGVHAKYVSELLGHSTIALTLDTYSHVTPTMHQHAARVMDEIVGGA